MFKTCKARMYCGNMKIKDMQEVFLVSLFKLCMYVKIRTGISYHSVNNFNFNFTLSFSCTREQYDGLDIEIKIGREKENLLPLLYAIATTVRL